MFIPVETGLLKASNPNSLSELDENVIMTDMWESGILKSTAWVKRKEITGKLEPS